MDALLKHDPYDLYIRTGKSINVAEAMDELEKAYHADLVADIDSYDAMEAVDSETYNDLIAVKKCLKIFNSLGYIDNEELAAMEAYAEALRKKLLEALNG